MEAGPEARPTQPPHSQRITDAEDLDLYGSPDTVNIDDILNVDMTPLSSISTSGPDTSVTTSVDFNTLLAVDFDDQSREIQDTAAAMLELADSANMVGAYRFRNLSLAPKVGCANIGESPPGTHPLTVQGQVGLGDTAPSTYPPTAQGYTSLGDAAPGMIPSMALGRYTESDDTAQDRFWTSTVEVVMLILFLICRCLSLIRVRNMIIILRR